LLATTPRTKYVLVAVLEDTISIDWSMKTMLGGVRPFHQTRHSTFACSKVSAGWEAIGF
jgi:hypothetical protein